MVNNLINFIQDTYRTKEFIPLHAPVFSGNETSYVLDTIQSTFVSSVGQYVDEFEQRIEVFTGTTKAVATINGTAALHTGLYLAGVKDFCSKEIVGYSMGSRMTKELTLKALEKAVKYRKVKPGAIHHSDRGVQYCSKKYVKAVKNAGFELSMSRKGNCFDNAPTESFWGALKQEFVYQNRFKTRLEAEAAIQEWIKFL